MLIADPVYINMYNRCCKKSADINNNQGYLFISFPWIMTKQNIKIFEKVMKP